MNEMYKELKLVDNVVFIHYNIEITLLQIGSYISCKHI